MSAQQTLDLFTKKPARLDAELVRHTENLPQLGKCIRHPLVYSIMHVDFLNAWANEMLRQKREQLNTAQAERDWHRYIFLYERPYRLTALEFVAHRATDAEYWPLLGSVWTDTENYHQNARAWRLLWQGRAPANYRRRLHDTGLRSLCMDKDDARKFAALRFPLTVYRGGAREHLRSAQMGLSWTTDLAKARWFASRMGDTPVVYERTVCRSQALAYFGARGESEVVVVDDSAPHTVVAP